ncbi:MAG: acetyl-CoA carboxylase biotin carboxyl carrier protein subunit [Acidobacteriota bacterium]|nr:acetyl-CoA carboxylase biotin carboxyl carrier protein subunit [Acidobacteriota bacterium]
MTYDVIIDGKRHRVELGALNNGRSRLEVKVDGRPMVVDAVLAERDVLSLLVYGKSYDIKRETTGQGEQTQTHMYMIVRGVSFSAEVRDPRSFRARKKADAGDAAGPRKLVSPMPGKVVRILAPAGTKVEAGEGVVVVEAMKMQNEIKSPKAGTVQRIVAEEGAAVDAGEVLAVVE